MFSNSSVLNCKIISPKLFKDERGYFFESFSESNFIEKGIPNTFVQDNQSFSQKGVLRGLHFQTGAFAQGKLVRVISGRVLDIAVDLRPKSETFGKYEFFDLDGVTNKMVYIPEGFAHGFLALEDSIFAYKCTAPYHKESEGGIIWNDPSINIQWPLNIEPLVSEKDLELPTFKDFCLKNNFDFPF